MTKLALDALLASIGHWKQLSETLPGEAYYRVGSLNCPLCRAFPGCTNCPVMESAPGNHRFSCFNTPYVKCARALWHRNVTPEEWKKLALEELDFLTSLLPKETDSK